MAQETPNAEVRGLALPIALLGGLLGRLAFWAPVIFAFLFVAQASLRGLKPAMAEEQRLAGEEERMRGVHEELVGEQQHLERLLEAYADPIYNMREIRAGRLRDEAPALVDSPTPYSTKAADGGPAPDGPAEPSGQAGPWVR